MQTNWGRAARWAVAVPAAMAVLSGCGVLAGDDPILIVGSAAPAGAPTPTASGASPTKAGSAPATGGAIKKGCKAGGEAIPKNSTKAETVDLDGDGQNDTLWLAVEDDIRVLGVETASGARMSTVFTNAAPTTANAVGGLLGDGSAVILLDFSREAKLYGVIDCKIYGYENAQGRQYTFDEGVNGRGTGVGCPEIGSQGRRLVGYLAEIGGYGDGYKVTRTIINLDPKEIVATNGETETVDEGAPESDQDVKRAKQIICGPGERVYEPAG